MFDLDMFFGRFHPLIVHLPIGFLLLAIIFKGLDLRSGLTTYRPALQISLLLSTIIAVVTCVTGLLLSWSGTYPEDELFLHKWSGIGLAAVTIAWYLTEFRWKVRPMVNYFALGVTIILLIITGHRGGVLTHGDTYLWEGMPVALQQFLGHDPFKAEKLKFEISSLDSALVYEDIVVPILEARCYSCHSDRKQKSELRLDSPEMMRKGGESGDRLITGDLEKSKLYHVLTLPIDEDEHMPPKGKTQLTKFEVEVIGSWVANGGDTEKMAMQYPDQKALVAWYDDLISDEKLFSNALIPTEKVSPPDEATLENLGDKGVLIQPVGKNSNYLEVSFINVPDLEPALVKEVAKLKGQVIWLDASGKVLSDKHLDGLTELILTTDLNLAHSTLPENGLKKLSVLKNIQILNLTGTDLGASHLEELGDWPALRKVFIYQAGIPSESIGEFQKANPDILIDAGGYLLPEVPRDTLVFRYKG